MDATQPLPINYASVTDATARGGLKTITSQITGICGGFTLPEQRTQFWTALTEYASRNRDHVGANAAGADGGETKNAGQGATHGATQGAGRKG